VEEEERDEELNQRVVRKLGAMDTRVHPCVSQNWLTHSSCKPTSFLPSFGTPFSCSLHRLTCSSSSFLFFFFFFFFFVSLTTNSSVFSTTAARLSHSLSAFSFFVENLRNFWGSQHSKFSRNYQLPCGHLRMGIFK
jgi:hypothetical protein